MTIGEKIKQIRQDKNLSQENVYPSNQSLVSQIEKGINKNPTEQTLRIMAKNMEISFEELIEGTKWEIPRNVSQKSDYAFSQTQCVVNIDDSGEIKFKMKSYPMKEDSGKENRFDPDTGFKLLTGCKSCKRIIQQPNQKYCFGCGEKLFNDYTWYENLFISKYYIDDQTGEEADVRDFESEIEMTNPSAVKVSSYDTQFTTDINSNQKAIGRLSALLHQLNDIDKVVNPALPYKASSKSLKGTDSILTELVGKTYYSHFKNHYFSMTKSQIKNSTFMSMKEIPEDIIHFDLTGRLPIGMKDLPSEHLSTKDYKGGFMLYDFVDINPNKCKSDIIVNWWILFKHDLSMTKGLLNELLRHQERLSALNRVDSDEELTSPEPKEGKIKN